MTLHLFPSLLWQLKNSETLVNGKFALNIMVKHFLGNKRFLLSFMKKPHAKWCLSIILSLCIAWKQHKFLGMCHRRIAISTWKQKIKVRLETNPVVEVSQLPFQFCTLVDSAFKKLCLYLFTCILFMSGFVHRRLHKGFSPAGSSHEFVQVMLGIVWKFS